MYTPTHIIEMIQEDCPSVFGILNKEYMLTQPYAGALPSKSEWEEFYATSGIQKPTNEQLLEALSDYSGDNYNTHYWAGRYAQMKLGLKLFSVDFTLPPPTPLEKEMNIFPVKPILIITAHDYREAASIAYNACKGKGLGQLTIKEVELSEPGIFLSTIGSHE